MSYEKYEKILSISIPAFVSKTCEKISTIAFRQKKYLEFFHWEKRLTFPHFSFSNYPSQYLKSAPSFEAKTALFLFRLFSFFLSLSLSHSLSLTHSLSLSLIHSLAHSLSLSASFLCIRTCSPIELILFFYALFRVCPLRNERELFSLVRVRQRWLSYWRD